MCNEPDGIQCKKLEARTTQGLKQEAETSEKLEYIQLIQALSPIQPRRADVPPVIISMCAHKMLLKLWSLDGCP